MRIYNNIDSITTQNSLMSTNAAMSKSLEKLSTGLRINRASDDAAGLALSEGLRKMIRGGDMARRNANDALAMLQIAEGGTQEITNSLQRMRELAIQASNGTYNNTDRGYLDQEFQQLSSEIVRISQSTQYNSTPMLSGGSTTIVFHVSAEAATASTIGFVREDLTTLVAASVSINSQGGATSAIGSLDTALASVLSLRSTIGSAMNRLEKTVSNLGVQITNNSDAESRIRDVDFATESTKFSRNQILTQSATSMLAQANQLPQGVLGLLRG